MATPSRGRQLQALAASGVLSAAVLAVCVNVLVSRFYERWDWTSRDLYTLSPATVETLQGLPEPVDVVVLLGRGDPLALSVRHLLDAYQTETSLLHQRFVDPDRDAAEFLAVQKQYDVLAGQTEGGQLVSDAALVVAGRKRHWFITAEELLSVDQHEGQVRPRLEQALTSAIRNVLGSEETTICFSTGHRELSIDSGGPDGLAEFRHRLERNNYQVQAVELGAAQQLPDLGECRLVAVVGPEVPFPKRVSEHLASYVRAGGSLLLLLDPMLGDDERVVSSGLEPVLGLVGIQLGNDLVIERAPELRLGQGRGESYFATPREHDVTRALVRGQDVLFRPLLIVSQSLHAAEGASPTAIVRTSERAFALTEITPLREPGVEVEPPADAVQGPLDVGLVAELPRPAAAAKKRPARVIVFGSSNLAHGRSWQDPAAVGNRLLIESAVAWLAARPQLVSVPDKPVQGVGLSLTEESQGAIGRYVLLYLPGATVLLGVWVLVRRRRQEQRSRQRPKTTTRDP